MPNYFERVLKKKSIETLTLPYHPTVHYQRIAHRDIKPANLLLGDGRVQVADLGACGELAGAGRLTGAVGTPAFRAPEAVASADKYRGEVSGVGRQMTDSRVELTGE